MAASAAPMLAAGGLYGGAIGAAGFLAREAWERWQQRRRIQQMAIGDAPVPAMAAPPPAEAAEAAPARDPRRHIWGRHAPLGVPDGGPGAPVYGPVPPPAAAAPVGVPAPPAVAPVPAAPAAAFPGAPPDPSPAQIATHAMGLSPAGGQWWRSTVAVTEPQFWWHIRYRNDGDRVVNYWKHKGAPRGLTDRERLNLVDHS